MPETANKIYDFLDTMRGVDAFLKGMPGASIQGLTEGSRVIDQKASNKLLTKKVLLCGWYLVRVDSK